MTVGELDIALAKTIAEIQRDIDDFSQAYEERVAERLAIRSGDTVHTRDGRAYNLDAKVQIFTRL